MLNSDILFVLGAPRSGTSALTRTLSLCSCSLPPAVAAANDMNPRGFWEPIEATQLNANFMSKHGSMLGDPSLPLTEERMDTPEGEAFITDIQAFLKKCPTQFPLVIKELRLAPLMRYWTEAARRGGFTVKIIIAVRHPTESVTSMTDGSARSAAANKLQFSAREKVSFELASAIWLTLNLTSERNTREFSRVFVHYENILTNWKKEVSRIADQLGVNLIPNETAISRFLTSDLHRYRARGPVVDNFSHSWISRVYSFLDSACEDRNPSLSDLDEIYEDYRLTERTFRIARENFCNLFSHFKTVQASVFNTTPVWKSGLDY